MRTSTQYLVNGTLALVFLFSVLPTPTQAAQLGDNQNAALVGQYGPGAPFGTVGKMLEEVNLYMHSESLAAAGTDYPTRIAESVTAGGDPTDTNYKQLQVPVASFRKPSALLTSMYQVTPDPTGTGCHSAVPIVTPGAAGKPCDVELIGDDPQDAANKIVRIGYLDPHGYAPGTPVGEPDPLLGALPVDPRPSGVDAYQTVSFLTAPEMSAQSDFRIYDVKLDAYARCGANNNFDTVSDKSFGDLALNVYRTDAFGNRILDDSGVDTPIATILASKTKVTSEGYQTVGLVPTANGPGLYEGSYLEVRPTDVDSLHADSLGLLFTPRPVPNFYLDGGLLVKQGERLEFQLGLDYTTSVFINTPPGEGVLSSNLFTGDQQPGTDQPIQPYDVECLLHFDTNRDENSPSTTGQPAPDINDYVANDPSKPVQSVQFPGRGYNTKVTIIADTLRASTWISDTNGRLAPGLGDGDTFNVDTVYASAWGSLASDQNLADQPKALNNRVASRFRQLDTLAVADFGAPVAGPFFSNPSDSILASRVTYAFAPGTKPLVAHGTELYIHDPSFDDDALPNSNPGCNDSCQVANNRPLILRDQLFEGSIFAVSPPVAIGKTGMNFKLAAGESSTHKVNPGEPTIFGYTVENLGSSADTITIVADPVGGGWTAEVLNSRQLVGGGGSASINVLVTPPTSAGAGSNSPAIHVRAISTFADIIPPKQAQDVTVSVVDAITRGVNITTATPTASVTPSHTRLIGVSVRNDGTAAQSILVSASVPASVQGWSLKVIPAAKQVPAGGRADFQIEVRAPNDAPANLQFPITVSAVAVGDGAIHDELSVVMKVVGDTDLGVVFFPDTRTDSVRRWGNQHEEGPVNSQYDTRQILAGTPGEGTAAEKSGTQCVGVPANEAPVAGNPAPAATKCIVTDQDPTFTDSVIFPVLLQNKGTLDDVYTAKRGHVSLSGCWKYRMYESGAAGDTPFTTSDKQPYSFAVAAGTSKVVDFELSCPRTSASSAAASAPSVEIALTFASQKDATLLRGPFSIKAAASDPGTYLGKGDFANDQHGVGIRLEDLQPDHSSVLRSSPARYIVRAQNLGNERDDVIIRANLPPSGSGWTQKLTFLNSTVGGDAGYCTQVSDLEIRCKGAQVAPANLPAGRYGLRTGEEVVVALDVTPGAFVPLGSTFHSVVSAASGADGQKTDLVEPITMATGTFVFDVGSRAPALTVERGGSASLPFAIRNLGTSGDDYAVSLTSGSPDYKPRLSVPDSSFVPAGTTLHGFLTVTAPANAAVGSVVPFHVQVASNGTASIGAVDLTATVVAPSNLRVQAVPEGVLIQQRGVDQHFQVKVTDLLGRTGTVKVSTDASRLPSGWAIGSNNQTVQLVKSGATSSGLANLTVRAPASDLGVSRVPLRFTAVGGGETGFSDVVFDLTSVAALSISVPDGASGVTSPGTDFVYSLHVKNNGTGNDKVTMSASGVPAGWTVSFNPAQGTLGPLEEAVVDMTVKAPLTATPRTIAPVLVFATGTSGAFAQKLVTTTIGFLDLDINRTSDATVFAGPGEAATFVYNVTNTGTLTGDVSVAVALANTQYAAYLKGAQPDLLAALRPGESRDVLVHATVGDAPPAGVRMPVTATAKFVSAHAPEPKLANATVQVLDYVAADADGDGIKEYAIDRDRTASNGFESFAESHGTSGLTSVSLDMTRYMSNLTLQHFLVDVPQANGTTTREVRFVLDGDRDGKVDHFIDTDGNLVPDVYWDPDSRVVSPINTTKDINGDDIPEVFVDLTGDHRFDAVYDLDKGEWTPLKSIDVDGDGKPDYVVDKNNNGKADQDETVLYTRSGHLLIVQMVDVDGDGKLDQVFDTDGDGVPDYFIPNGSTQSVPLVMRDVNGDGVLDWTFDGNNDGRNESYYDPATGQSHVVSPAGHLVEALKHYWYIGALFGMVALLFIALLAVTRR